VQVTPDDIVPVLVLHHARPTATVVHPFLDGVAVTYAPVSAPDQAIGWADLTRLGLTERTLRSRALHNLDAMLGGVSLHGSFPALMVSFGGIESSLLLADAFWERIDLPGDPVVAVPARDVLLITGSESVAGLAKARRCVERVHFAGTHHLLVRDLLERRGDRWVQYDEAPPEVDDGTWEADRDRQDEYWSPPEDRTIVPRPGRSRYG
jgi:hypothetical protein